MSGSGEACHHDVHCRLTEDYGPIFVEDPFMPETQRPPAAGYYSDYLHGSLDYGSLEKEFDLPSEIFDWGNGTNETVFPPAHDAVPGVSAGGHGATSAGNPGGGGGSGSGTPTTPDSMVSSSSDEAPAADDDGGKIKEEEPLQGNHQRCEDHGNETPKKVQGCKTKKKGEKRQGQPRFAFLTKSEVDHLEDGYRWRKYGQKAVKNSPYPRSYYRCTTQKCPVKKRVERSCQDPSTVITTYEGQHIHLLPANLRGTVQYTSYSASPTAAPAGFFHHHHNDGMLAPPPFLKTQLHAGDRHGLLEDIIPPFVQGRQP